MSKIPLKKYLKNKVYGLNFFRFLVIIVIFKWLHRASFKTISDSILGYFSLLITFIDIIVLFINLFIEIHNVHSSLQTGEDYHFLTDLSKKKLTFPILKPKSSDVKKQ